MRRLLLALAGIVAVMVIFLGIKDHVQQQKKAKPLASTSTTTVVASNAITVRKKTTSEKIKRVRMFATEADAPATAQAADDMKKAGATPTAGIDNAPNTVRAQTAHDEADAAALSSAQCLPLPNGTKPGHVDAAYYKNWAREYSCLIP